MWRRLMIYVCYLVKTQDTSANCGAPHIQFQGHRGEKKSLSYQRLGPAWWHSRVGHLPPSLMTSLWSQGLTWRKDLLKAVLLHTFMVACPYPHHLPQETSKQIRSWAIFHKRKHTFDCKSGQEPTISINCPQISAALSLHQRSFLVQWIEVSAEIQSWRVSVRGGELGHMG